MAEERINFKKGKVIKIIKAYEGLTLVEVKVDGLKNQAINYEYLTGAISPGDEVILNTTALDLGLGSGGFHFVLWNTRYSRLSFPAPGHIMKLRYTPFQLKCLAFEERESPYHYDIKNKVNLEKMPVIIGSLHSQLPAIALTLKKLLPKLKISYIMTDGGALPIYFSDNVRYLKERGVIDKTITIGNAFGGDLEAVNIYSGLIAAKEVVQSDVAIVIMGPGILGTGTALGHTGLEQGEIINAVNILKGFPIAVPRMHFKEKRKRHYGISHHTITSLSLIALTPCVLPLPQIERGKMDYVLNQLEESGISLMHKIEIVDASITLSVLKEVPLSLNTMGRGIDEEPEFFMAAGSSAVYLREKLKNKESEK